MPAKSSRAILTLRHDISLTAEDIVAVGAECRKVALAPATRRLLAKRRREIMAHVAATREPAYGFNRGFGHNVKLAVAGNMTAELQENLIASHACGVGEPMERGIIRMAMLLRAQSLARGHSGVRPIVVETIIRCLNADIVPFVPRYGTVSASGDLAPLSHIAYGLLGRGRVFYRGKVVTAAAAMRAAQIAPLRLEEKEGLALNNGVQYSNAIAIAALDRMQKLLKSAVLSTAMAAQVMLGADTPFRADLHALRPHRGSRTVARWIFALMQDSPIRKAHQPYDIDGEIQDPYNLRCAAQILGGCEELLRRAGETFIIEANSVTDNPIMLPRKTEAAGFVDIVSGGHFHGMPVAIDLHGLLQAAGIIASLTNARCQRYVDENRNKGLGADLKWPGPTDDPRWLPRQAVWSGMMIPEYVTAGLANYIWGAAMPTHLMSISTDSGQEDHVSMAANLGLRLLDVIPRLADALAVEFAFIGQAAALRKEMDYIPSRVAHAGGGNSVNRHYWKKPERRLNDIGEAALALIYRAFPPVKQDRYMADDLARLSQLVAAGSLIAQAEAQGFFGEST